MPTTCNNLKFHIAKLHAHSVCQLLSLFFCKIILLRVLLAFFWRGARLTLKRLYQHCCRWKQHCNIVIFPKLHAKIQGTSVYEWINAFCRIWLSTLMHVLHAVLGTASLTSVSAALLSMPRRTSLVYDSSITSNWEPVISFSEEIVRRCRTNFCSNA